jgi:DNA-binding NarL/FixJ family response regulator
MGPIQLLLVDDHVLFRESLRRLLDSQDGFDVVGDCATKTEACAVVARCTVDVTLLDFDLAGHPGSECICALRQAGYEGRILMVTAGMTSHESSAALGLGASGIVLKHNSPSMLMQAIRTVAGGTTWVDPRAMQAMAERTRQSEHMHEPDLVTTDREQRVLQGVFEGLTNKEIGARTGASESAVKGVLQQLFHKAGVRTRSQLVRIALERTLTTTTPPSRPVERPSHGDVRKIGDIWPKDVWPASMRPATFDPSRRG